MSSGTAYYNLRKDASTDNYNVAVVNQNLDDIDAQMHQNEVAATTTFTGASSSANGEKGIVPRPVAGDQEKFLCGDGTWKPVQGGGGGSTVTITPTLATGRKIAEYEIDGTNGSLFAPLVEITGEASGSIATFTDGADGKPVKNLEISIEPQQDLHGYDNPWVGGSGKNKLPLTVESIKTASDKSTWNNNSITINGVTYEIQVDTNGNVLGIKTNGTANGDSNLRIYDGGAEFYGKLLNGCPSNGSINTYYMQLSNVSVGSDYDLGNGTVINQTDTGRWILIINIKSGTTVSNLIFKPMIRLATVSDATFEPYSNICPISGWSDCDINVANAITDPTVEHTYTIDLDGTCYGGELDVVSGVLTVDRAYVDLGTLNYTYYSGNLFTASISDLKPISNEKLCNALCSIYVAKKGIEYASIDGSFVAGFNNSRTLAIHDSRFTDATTFKTAVNGVQLVYELATPQTYQLTPTQVSTLLGQNNIFADCGDVEEVVYVRDINLAFNQLEARVAALEGSNSRSVSLTKSAPIEETKEETKEEEPNEVKEKEEKDDN